MEKIYPASERWTTPELASDIGAPRRLTVGPEDTIYFQFERDGLYALAPNGQAVPGWPVRVLDGVGGGGRMFIGTPLIEPTTGTVFLAARTFVAFDIRPWVFVAIEPNGTESWRLESRDLGTPFLGPAGNLYLLSGSRFGHYERVTGTPLCEVSESVLFHKAVGSKDGIFSSFRESVSAHAPDCSVSRIFENVGRTNTVVQDVRLGMTFATDTRDSQGPNHETLLAIGADGQFRWRSVDFRPTEIRGAYGSTLFVAGYELSDPVNRRLFLVNALSGELLQRIDLAGWCEGCDENMTIDRNGDIYFARDQIVYRLVYPYF